MFNQTSHTPQATRPAQRLVFWSYTFGVDAAPNEEIQTAYAQFHKRFQRAPRLVHVHSRLLRDAGLLCPVGVDLVVDDRIPQRAFYFVVAGGAS
jgi:hypothetical protein